MKIASTVRTLKRHGVDPDSVGFAGYIPNGKEVVRLAKAMRAQRRLLSAVAEIHPDAGSILCKGSMRQSVKIMTRFLRADSVVQQAWVA